MMTKFFLLFELIAMYAPAEIRIDPFEYVKTNSVWHAYVSPTGFGCEQERYFNYMYLSINRKRQEDLQNVQIQQVSNAYMILMQSLQVQHNSNSIGGGKDFSFKEAWIKVAPNKFVKDL